MNNDIVQWRSHPRYFKEIDRKISNCNSYCCHTNNRKNNSNNNKNKDSYVNNLDNKQWNVVSSEATTECASSIDVAVATKLNCDKKNFNSSIATFNNDSDSDKNSSCSSCETFERCRRQQNADATTITNATTTNINDTFRSIPLIKGDDDDDAPSKFRVKRIAMVEATNQRRQNRTFYISKNNKNKNSRSRSSISSTSSTSSTSTTLSSHYLYRILFLWLQLFAALLTFTHNFGFVLALPSNAIDDCSSCTEDNSGGGHYTHTWAVHIPNGEEDGLADRVARDHGFINRGKIFNDHYHFEHHKISKRSLTPSDEHQSRLIEDSRVYWSKQQRAKSRQKRDFIRLRPSRTSSRALSLVDAVPLNDPKWPQMWYLNRGGGLDMNVIPAWKEGITGKGIVVTILDDGLESDHPDIEHNYDPLASYDVNSHDDDPMPHYDMTDSNRHGTRCAGEVAATANNSICAVGIAFGASVGGVRMLDGDVTDAVEARSLSLNPQHIDIYSASWGPDDDGKTVDGPGEMASRAFIEGVTKGRSGKGSIFIWASGNGGRELDNCNCDGYTNSIWTLSISSATEDGHVPWYSEKCSSTLATTYSSGGQGEKQVVTTDLHHSCTVSHTGTSASAPLAAGIAALVLESNNNLTWRDLQHIVVRTAKPANLKDPTWSKNGVGRRISHSFGYGLMDAAAMVRVARTWKTVPEQQRCEINAPHVDKTIPPEGYITLQLAVKHCMSVNYLEHVQAKITLTSQRRGDIQLYLKSPAGTRVTLLTSRLHDNSRSGFNQWPFMSVHTWGESPHGNWQLEIHNQGRYKAQITQWDLIFYGTEVPAQPDDAIHIGSAKYDSFSGEMEHNDIEFDASGQWRNMQQVGESVVKSHDRTDAACTKTTIDQRCLDCAPPTFLYDGRCFDECPRHTYVVINEPSSLNNPADIKTYSTDSDQEQLLSTDKRRRRRRRVRCRRSRGNHRLSNTITTIEMAKNFSPQRQCHMCDSSCYQCYGPSNSQCSTCYPGSQLHRQPDTNETYCNAFAERSTNRFGDVIFNSRKQSFSSGQYVLSLVGIVAFVICTIVVSLYRRIIFSCNGNSNMFDKVQYSYDRVALLEEAEQDGDNIEEEENKSKSLRNVMNENSKNANNDDSEEEIDLFSAE